VPKAIRLVANAQRQMTGKRNANGDFKADLQKFGASTQPTSARASHLQRPGEGVMNGGPAPSARAQAILKQSNAYLPRNAFKPKRTGEEYAARLHAKAPKTMALEEEDLEFEDDKEALATIARQHAASIAHARQDASRAKQREVAERLRATGLTLTKPDPNDTSAKKPTSTVRAAPKPLPETLKAHGLQMATVEQLERKLKSEITRREALEKENEELRRQLAEARGAPASSFAPARPAMRDVTNGEIKAKVAVTSSTTAKLFGHVAASAVKSRYADEADEEDMDQMMKNIDALEERDQLAAQLALKREVKVKVYHCRVCEKKTRFFDASTCKEHRESVKHVDSIMRYFRCKGCNRTNTSFDSLTPKRCEKSGCMSVAFERVTAADVTAAARPRKEDLVAVEGNVANRDALAARGVEHGFRLDTIHNSA
jgi:minichromosome maintenance protein 10